MENVRFEIDPRMIEAKERQLILFRGDRGEDEQAAPGARRRDQCVEQRNVTGKIDEKPEGRCQRSQREEGEAPAGVGDRAGPAEDHGRWHDHGRGQHKLRLQHEGEPGEEADRRVGARRGPLDPVSCSQNEREQNEHAVRGLVRIGKSVVERAVVEERRKREDKDKYQTGGDGPDGAPCPAEKAVDQPEDRGKNDEVGNRQHDQSGAEETEETGVEILRKRTVDVVDVAIEHGSLGETPGRVEFATGVDGRMAPFSPRDGDEPRSGGDEGGDPAAFKPRMSEETLPVKGVVGCKCGGGTKWRHRAASAPKSAASAGWKTRVVRLMDAR